MPATLVERRRSFRRKALADFIVSQRTLSSLPSAIRPKIAGPISQPSLRDRAPCTHSQSIANTQRMKRSKIHLKTVRHLHMQSRGGCARRCGSAHPFRNLADAIVEFVQCSGFVSLRLLSHGKILLSIRLNRTRGIAILGVFGAACRTCRNRAEAAITGLQEL